MPGATESPLAAIQSGNARSFSKLVRKRPFFDSQRPGAAALDRRRAFFIQEKESQVIPSPCVKDTKTLGFASFFGWCFALSNRPGSLPLPKPHPFIKVSTSPP
jgi:hypothetical protein